AVEDLADHVRVVHRRRRGRRGGGSTHCRRPWWLRRGGGRRIRPTDRERTALDVDQACATLGAELRFAFVQRRAGWTLERAHVATRSRPSALARYSASSARAKRPSTVSTPSDGYTDTPTLAVTVIVPDPVPSPNGRSPIASRTCSANFTAPDSGVSG